MQDVSESKLYLYSQRIKVCHWSLMILHIILSLDSVKGTGIKAVDAEKIIGIWDRYLGLRETNKIAVIKTSHFVRYKSGSENVCYSFIFFSKKFAEEGEFYIHPEVNYGDENSVSR